MNILLSLNESLEKITNIGKPGNHVVVQSIKEINKNRLYSQEFIFCDGEKICF